MNTPLRDHWACPSGALTGRLPIQSVNLHGDHWPCASGAITFSLDSSGKSDRSTGTRPVVASGFEQLTGSRSVSAPPAQGRWSRAWIRLVVATAFVLVVSPTSADEKLAGV